MKKALALALLLTAALTRYAQAQPAPTDGVVFTTTTAGVSYPHLTSVMPPPPCILQGKGSVDLVKYPGGQITSTQLTVTIEPPFTPNGQPPAWGPIPTTATVTANKLSFTIQSPAGGIPATNAKVTVTGKFRENLGDPNSRDFTLTGYAFYLIP